MVKEMLDKVQYLDEYFPLHFKSYTLQVEVGDNRLLNSGENKHAGKGPVN